MSNYEHSQAAVSRQDWSLDRQIQRDDQRHNEKVKDAIKNNLDSIVSDGTIISADPSEKKKVRVPMRSLELPNFRFGEPKEGLGTGEGEGTPAPGDQIGKSPGQGEAGDQPGEEFYETEMTIEEIQSLVFEDLGLPNIKPRDEQVVEDEEVVFNDVRKKRTPTNLDLGRTVLQNMLRNAQETGVAKIHNISPDDFRVRTWELEQKPKDSAVVIAMADVSGSMGDFQKYVTRAFCWWAVAFLRTKYPKVEIVFVTHDVEASVVTERQFFTRKSGGGTLVSSANRKALELVNERYQTTRYNVYPLHFSDGDNSRLDNTASVNAIQELLDLDISQYAYVQISKAKTSVLKSVYDKSITNERFKSLVISEKDDILDALKKVFALDKDTK